MLLRRVRFQIGLFFLIAVLGVGYAGWRYAGLDRLFGHRGYLVTVELARGGGVFPGADVTYRGVSVGRVAELRLTGAGVEAQLDIDPDAPKVPVSAKAVVANRSAIGEQYLDLRPEVDGGPYLDAGSRIAQDASALPPRPEQLLANADALLTSLPLDSLRTVVDELDKALSGSGPHLQRILDSTNSFLPTAMEHLPQTKSLLSDGRTVLATQQDLAEPVTTFAEDLRSLAGQLKASDPDIRKLINVGPPLAAQAGEILAQSGPDLSVLFANLLTTSNLMLSRIDGLEQGLILYPYLPVIGRSVFPGDGTAHLGLVLNLGNPPGCTKGYEGTQQRAGSDLSEVAANTQAYCAEPPGSLTGVRGAQNAPYGGVVREVPAPAVAPSVAAEPGLPGVLGGGNPLVTGIRGLLGLDG
ncbi:MlaD family protein [Amycolatopsis nigrescens]|uniref:MlaD family protein n=1 Tax=Amycolatopsis nigrescens TaxID=381445 RepID=UPI000360DCFB|nr:MlaD family protein [Amycolatopsis nigrescens]